MDRAIKIPTVMRNRHMVSILLLLIFSLLAIVGEKNAGFYIEYIISGLFNISGAGITGTIGILLVIIGLFSSTKFSIFNTIGVLFMIFSLFIFFFADEEKYNYPTFKDPISIISFSLFFVSVVLLMRESFKPIKIEHK
jgi:hypothetical protein